MYYPGPGLEESVTSPIIDLFATPKDLSLLRIEITLLNSFGVSYDPGPKF